MLRSLKCFLLLSLYVNLLYGQGLNHNFLLGIFNGIDTNVISTRGKLEITNNSINTTPATFPMKFLGAQANISDENGNLLMYSNGCYIADATGNIMQNGDSINPGLFADNWCTIGLPVPNSNIFLPYPGDSNKYILFHQTSTDTNQSVSSEIYYSIIDITLNNGLGAVTLKKQIAISAALSPGMAACKHANGRDWWIISKSSFCDTIYSLLLTPNGINILAPQAFFTPFPYNIISTLTFSPDGSKFAYFSNYTAGSTIHRKLRILDFDRCNGLFSHPKTISDTTQNSGTCLAFSPNSKYIYYGSFRYLFQINTDTSDMKASRDTIAIQDNYCYPLDCSNFWLAYLAANGKIYISSSGTTIDLHYIDQPDSEGLGCDMQLHALRVPCYTVRANVYHPNYYLGPEIGSACDSLAHVGIYELEQVKNLLIKPNPSRNGNFSVSYLLPQNQNGVLSIHDLFGKLIYRMNLPTWSSLQDIQLNDVGDGVYVVTIESGGTKESKRLVLMK